MNTLISTLDDNLAAGGYQEWEATTGYGPCGAYATIRREQGWGDVAVCMAHDKGTPWELGFGHYVIVSDGAIIDMTNPFDEELQYSEIEVLDADEYPELVDDDDLALMRALLDS